MAERQAAVCELGRRQHLGERFEMMVGEGGPSDEVDEVGRFRLVHRQVEFLEVLRAVRRYPPVLSRSEQTVIVVMPERSRSVTLKASAPPANDSSMSPRNSSDSRRARLAVTACSALPDRYIMSSSGNTVRWFSTSSVLESLSPNVSPFAAAMAPQVVEHGDSVHVFRGRDRTPRPGRRRR